jgi:hypothetical protein
LRFTRPDIAGLERRRRTAAWAAAVAMLALVACGTARVDDDARIPVDASEIDAPDIDAGPDAAPPDGIPDAEPPDADPPDAGPPDAEVPIDLAALCGAVPVTPDDWERCYQLRVCGWYVRCPINNYRDLDECLEQADAYSEGRIDWEIRQRQRAIGDGRTSIDERQFAQCLQEFDPTRCNTAATHPSCFLRYHGIVPDDGACHADVECASPGARCEKTCPEACCEGTCRRQPRLGEDCTTGYSCEPGLQCALVARRPSVWRCVSGDVGSPCSHPTYCDANAWCDEHAGICKADRPDGSACGDLLQCRGETTCVGEIAGNGRCLRVTQPGDVCEDNCKGNLQCVRRGGVGTCTPLPEPGEPCGFACAGLGFMCDRGRCVKRNAIGEACRNGSCLPGLFCALQPDGTSVCESPRADGEACTAPLECDSYLCSPDGVCLPWRDSCEPVVAL